MTESLHALSGAYVVGALDDHEREIFEAHLPGCLDCQAEVASLREAAAVLAADAELTPPESLRASVLSGIRNIRPLPPESDVTSLPYVDGPRIQQADATDIAETTDSETDDDSEEPTGTGEDRSRSNVVPMRRRRFRIATLAAAAAVVTAIGIGGTWQPWQDNPTSTLSAADRVLAASDAQRVSTEFTDGSSATVVRSVKEGRAVLLTRNMAAPPSGKAFELWLRDEQGRLSPAGLMTTAGDHKLLLSGDATKATGVGITVEPAAGSPQPTTKPLAMLELDEGEA